MPYYTYYTPIVREVENGKVIHFTVNGAITTDKEESIRLTLQHVAFRNKETKIIRIDEREVFEYD